MVLVTNPPHQLHIPPAVAHQVLLVLIIHCIHLLLHLILVEQRVDEKPAPNIQSLFKLILIDFEVVSRRMVLCEGIGSALILAYKVEE